MTLWQVCFGNYYPREVEGVYLDEAQARARAHELGPPWNVEPLYVAHSLADLPWAIAFARDRHEGQTDKSGQPFFGHPLRVLARLAPDPVLMTIGVLHDTVEDTATTIADIREAFGDRVADAVDALSRRKSDGETWNQFIQRILRNPDAIRVKLADIADNSDPRRADPSVMVDGCTIGRRHW